MSDFEFLKEMAIESMEFSELSPHEVRRAFSVAITAMQDSEDSMDIKREAAVAAVDAYIQELF